MRVNFFSLLISIGCIILFCSISNTALATHIAGGQLTYQYRGNNGLDYRVTYTFYRDCDPSSAAAPANVTVNVISASAGYTATPTAPQIAGPTQVVPICPAPANPACGGVTPGREEYIYQVDITLPSKRADWVFSVSLGNRNNAITTINPTTVNMYVESTLNNTINTNGQYNNAPVFANNPAAFTFVNQPFCFNNGAMEVDGDSLVYSLITPKTSSTTNVTYNVPYTASQPLTSSPAVTFNTATGDVCMTPTNSSEVTVMAILVKEYRYGILIGSVERDIQVSVLSGTDNLPFMDGINSTNIYFDTIPAGCNYTFSTKSFDADVAQNVTMSSTAAAAVPFFSSFTTSGGSRPTGTFIFNPGSGDVQSQPYCFTVTVRDDHCDIEGQQVKAFCLWVIDFTADFTSSAPACVGQAVNFYSVQPIKNSYTYFWNFGSGAVATFAQVTSANPVGVTYSTPGAKTVQLTISGPGGCSVTKTNIITINPSPTSSFTSTAPQCVGSAVDFTNTGSTGAGTTYAWNFGAGATPATSTAQSPTGIMYSSSGPKVVTLTTTNNFGCVTTSTQTIVINQTPVASFTSTAPKCTGASVDFTNTGTVVGVSWSWNFGSGAAPATSTVQSPTGIIYSTPGSKVVTLTTTNLTTNCTSTYTTTININQAPTTSFISSATSPQCSNVPVNFTNTGSTGGSWTYFWDFGSGAMPLNSSAENPNGILYSSGGPKVITFTISDANCSTTSTQTITITSAPVASFTSNAPICTGDSVNFQNTGTSGATYAWTFGSGAAPATSTAQNPMGIIYNTAGIKTVKLVTSMNGCKDSSTQTILINQTPSVSFTSNAPQCAGNAVNFTNTGSTGGNWTFSWAFGAGATPAVSSSENPSGVIYSTAGTKTITLTISDGTCSNTITQTITINALPLANAGKDTIICNNTSVQIGSSSVAGNTYSWFPPSTLSNPAIANPVASPIAPTTIYIVTVTNTATGCTNSDSVVVTMLAPLAANAGPDVAICRYDSIQVGAALVTGENYAWSPSSGLSSTTSPNPMCSPSVTTTYTLSVTGPGCGPVLDEVTVTVHPLPIADAGPDDTITVGSSTQLTATGGIQYTWTPATGLSNVSIYNPVANPVVTIMYYVTVTDVFGCVNKDSMTVYVIEPNFWIPTAFTPNGDGQNDVLYAHGEGISGFELGVYNRWGELIWSTKDIKVGWDGRRQIGGQELPEGAYVFYVKGKLSNGKVIDTSGIINLIR